MKEEQKHTPGPYAARPIDGKRDAEIYSIATGESIAHVRSASSYHKNAPPEEAALHNATLFRAAPRLRASLESILLEEHERMRPETVQSARELLAQIDAGIGIAFLEERAELERLWEESVRLHCDEMALQTKVERPADWVPDIEEDEDLGHSF